MLVSDIMTRNVLTVSPDASVQDIAWGLRIRGVSGAPVKDGDGHLLGIVSRTDLNDPSRVGESAPESSQTTAGEAMTPALFAVRDTDTVLDAAKRMVETGTHRLVVVDADGKLVGIVTPMDVLRCYVTRGGSLE
ncbi:MAG: CBS domain-containing protein [Polyangiaceae bacterium]|nr:CBS domain-containing protein [Myxococcales bacterium]MCB9590989.1 CBS domain-containing protein [Polyangiaceae bacterium]